MYQAIVIEVDNSVGILTLNRAERHNVLDELLIGEMTNGLLELEADPDGRRSRLAWTVIGGEQGFGRVELRHQDQRLEALVWPDREARGEAVRLPLLDGVDALRWRLLAAGQAHTQWPSAESRNRRRGRVAIVTPLPEAVEFTLELADVGTVVRVLALR